MTFALELISSSSEYKDEGMIICLSDVHPIKAEFPILFTEIGIVTNSNDEQSEKAFSPIKFKEDGLLNVTCFSDVHLLKALIPICVTEEGIIIEDSFEHSSKAFHPISVTEEGIVISIKEEQ